MPDIIFYDKHKKAHCRLLESDGVHACFNCPLEDCKCTTQMTKDEADFNNDMLYALGINNRTGGKNAKPKRIR